MAVWQGDSKAGSASVCVRVAACVPVTGVMVCEGLRSTKFLRLSMGRTRPQAPRTYSMKSLTGSLLPRRGAGRGGAEPSPAGTKGAASRGGGEGRGLGRGRVVGDVTGAGWRGRLRNASSRRNPIRPGPTLPRLRRWPSPGRGSRTTSTLQSPSPRHPTAEEPMGPQCPNPRAPGPLTSRRPHSQDPRVLDRRPHR